MVGYDWKHPEFEPTHADMFFNVDLRSKDQTKLVYQSGGRFDEVYSLAANMGGMKKIADGDATHINSLWENSQTR